MLRVLGVIEIDGHGPVASRAQRSVLAALALDLGHVVRGERLAQLVWGDEQPAHPAASLQNHISRLRKILPQDFTIDAAADGYRLDASPDQVDLTTFDRVVTEACGAPPEDRLDGVDRALALWRGEPFTDLDDSAAAAAASRLHESFETLGELRAESLIALGRAHEAIADLETQRQSNPMRERTVELLMRALVDAGRKTDALDAYRRLRQALVDELGLDPGPELRELERAILTEELVASRPSTIEPAGPPVMPAPAGRPRATRAVPLPPSSFLGRSEDLATVQQMVADHRVVTLVGPGGVGKTRLALHAAASMTGVEIASIELAPLRDPTQLPDVVATALGLGPRTGVSTIGRVIDALGSRPHLVVLDNCEHVIDAAAAFVDAVARGAPGVRILATSREPLNIDGERVHRLAPLPAGDISVELFADRAVAARADFVLDEQTRPLVERICRSLDGLPLAIELAAARYATMTLEQLVDGLDERFAVFRRGRRTADERHQSLRALVGWSVRSLEDDLRLTFTELSVFAGGFTSPSAAVVCVLPEPDMAEALADLVDRSLLVQHRVAGRRTRYVFLDTIRAYAAELLAASSEAADVAERHDAWTLGQVEAMRSALTGPDDLTAVDDVMASLPELRVAHRRFVAAGDADRSLRMAAALHHVALFTMHAEIFGWIMESADRFGEADHPNAEGVLASASIGSWQSGDLAGARRYAEWANRVGNSSTWPGAGRGAAEAGADIVQFEGDDRGALALFEQALDLSRQQDDELRIVSNLVDLAINAGYLGRSTLVDEAIAEARRRLGPDGPALLGSWLAYGEGEALAEIDPPRAIAALTRALELADRSGAQFVVGVAGLTRVGLQIRTGDAAAAVPGLIDVIRHWQAGGAWIQQWITMRSVVDLLVRLGRLRAAAVVLGAILATDSATEVAGADAVRLDRAREAIETDLPEAGEALAEGAALDPERVVESALRGLRSPV